MFEVRAKKHLGQHFLKDNNIAEKIVNSIPTDVSQLLEIGPGTGMLSRHLLKRNFKHLKLIEIDRESVEHLIREYAFSSDDLISADFLKYPITGLFDGKFWIAGNFPYNIGSQILFKTINHRDTVDGVVCMLQKEVAERLCSGPGNKDYGILSVLLQAWYKIEYLFTVSEKVFVPPPKVKSAVIRLQRNNTIKLDCDEDLFIRIVKASFNTRRKTIRNGLKPLNISSDVLSDEIFNKRPEQLGVDEFVYVTRIIPRSLA